MNQEVIKVALVEDDREIRESLASLINGSPGLHCVAGFATAEEALERMPTVAPDVVLMDIRLPGMSGIDCIRRLKNLAPDLQIMMLTVFDDHDKIFQSLAAGATGYLLKNTTPAKLIEAIQDLHQGGSPMSGQIARRVVKAFQAPQAKAAAEAALTKREQEILTHLSHGLLYKEIANALGISIETVRTHIRNIYEKLQVRTRTEAVLKAIGR
jgi:DNA-binding NarL/FixJ family response regulator